MPYISQEARERLHQTGDVNTPGELNFAITEVVCGYLAAKGNLSYTNLNEVIGVLECVKQELYRRQAAPYEDLACQTSGDVYPWFRK